ncbi:MAG: multicopper oxidase domain-containing protein, partial [Potamolinea sp.]
MNITRREAIKLGLSSSGYLLLPPVLQTVAVNPFSPQIKPFGLPFRTPPVLKPVRSNSTTDYYEIVMQKSQVEILPGLKTEIWSYNGITPGPTFKQSRGRESVVRFINKLDIRTSIHLHGMASLPQYDGYADDLIPPNHYKDYVYP